jgi:hypothetical protein
MTRNIDKKKYRLRIKRLDFISAVDAGAQGDISNVALIKRKADGLELTCQVSKLDESLGLVFGWALASTLDGGKTDHVDFQDDVVETNSDDFIAAAAEFMEKGAESDVMHNENVDGRVVFAMPLVPEVNAALGIKSDVHGLAIAMKPSPETFKRFQSGELRAFSIGGVGSREEIEDDTEKRQAERLAKRKAELEKTMADAAAFSKAQAAQFTKMLDDNPDGILASVSCARMVIEGKLSAEPVEVAAAKAWLAARKDDIEKSKLVDEAEAIEKRVADNVEFDKIMKGTEVSYAKALDDLNSFAQRWADENKVDRRTAMYKLANRQCAPEVFSAFSKLYDAHNEAHKNRIDGGAMVMAESMYRVRDQAYADAEKMVEQYALDHVIDKMKAREFLAKNSTSYKGLIEKSYDLGRRADMLAADVKNRAVRWRQEQVAKAAKAAREEEAAAARKRMTPSERALHDRIGKIAAERGETRPVATVWALENDETCRALYNVSTHEARS